MQAAVTEIHSKLQSLINIAPIIKQLFKQDVSIGISDTEKVIFYLPSKELSFESSASESTIYRKLEPQDPMTTVIKTKKRLELIVPKELYGHPLRIIGVPIFSDEKLNEVIGSISITMNIDTQIRLKNVSEKFSSSSAEIYASTKKLTESSTDFNKHIENLSNEQKQMSIQVENTTKILEMINTVAKNTRILGFNAGIEAARSGEYGKGFGVVAKEITKLADQSANSVNEIRNLLDQLKEKVDQVEKIVNETVEISKNQSTSIEEITKNIKNLSEVAEDIEDLTKNL